MKNTQEISLNRKNPIDVNSFAFGRMPDSLQRRTTKQSSFVALLKGDRMFYFVMYKK